MPGDFFQSLGHDLLRGNVCEIASSAPHAEDTVVQSGGDRVTLGGALRMKTLVVNTSRAWSWADGLPPNIEVRASQMSASLVRKLELKGFQ